jgi:hypothetical protein
MIRRRLGLFLAILLLATAPGCRAIAGAAILVGEAAIEAALDDDDDCCEQRRDRRPAARRAPAAPRDPCR